MADGRRGISLIKERNTIRRETPVGTPSRSTAPVASIHPRLRRGLVDGDSVLKGINDTTAGYGNAAVVNYNESAGTQTPFTL